MDDLFCQMVTDPAIKFVFAAVLLLLILVVFAKVYGMWWFKENLTDQKQVYNSGADLRFQSELSGTNQDENWLPGENANIMAVETNPGAEMARESCKLEAFAGDRGQMDTWAVGHDLSAYAKNMVTGQTPGLSPNRQGMNMQNMAEHLTNDEIRGDPYEGLLQENLYLGA